MSSAASPARSAAELAARRRSLYYLERLRLIHAVLTTHADRRRGRLGHHCCGRAARPRVGDLVLITALAFAILHGTRDLAVALVDLTQHVARLEEAIGSLLTEHELPDRPHRRDAAARPRRGDVRARALRLSGPRAGAARLRPDDRARPAGRAGRLIRARASPPCWRCCSASTTSAADAS